MNRKRTTRGVERKGEADTRKNGKRKGKEGRARERGEREREKEIMKDGVKKNTEEIRREDGERIREG